MYLSVKWGLVYSNASKETLALFLVCVRKVARCQSKSRGDMGLVVIARDGPWPGGTLATW